MNIKIYSREEMEKLLSKGIPDNTAIISFYNPKSQRVSKDYLPIDYSGKCNHVFQICLYDIDIEILKDYGLTYDTYLPEADDLAKFIYEAKQNGLDIICQCEYGQSRSAACAAAIAEHFYKTGIWIHRYIHYKKSSSNKEQFFKKYSNRVVRKKDVPRRGNGYRKCFDYWWTID